jgi:putative addiction module component (TIGR02574 family)
MSHTLEEIRQIALELPEEQRIQLANSLWNSIHADEELGGSELDAEWAAEIERRLHEIDSGNARLSPAEDVIARMDAKIAARQRG